MHTLVFFWNCINVTIYCETVFIGFFFLNLSRVDFSKDRYKCCSSLILYLFNWGISWKRDDILWRLCNLTLWAKSFCTHISVACPVLSSWRPTCTAVCWRMCILCQIQHRHKQDFWCVFEWASPCLVSFPSPESSKGPSIRGQAAVTASLTLSPRWPAVGPGCWGRRGTETIGLDTGHGTTTPPTPHPV